MLIAGLFANHNHTICLNMKSGDTKDMKCDEDGYTSNLKDLTKGDGNNKTLYHSGHY